MAGHSGNPLHDDKSEKNNLNDQHQRKECLEIPMVCLVVINVHRQHAAECAEKTCRKEQNVFRNPPFSLSGALFVVFHQKKADQIHDHNYRDQDYQLQIHDTRHILPEKKEKGGIGDASAVSNSLLRKYWIQRIANLSHQDRRRW